MAKKLSALNGWKTYGLATLFTAYALFGWWFEIHDANTAIQMIQTSGLGATMRHAIGRA